MLIIVIGCGAAFAASAAQTEVAGAIAGRPPAPGYASVREPPYSAAADGRTDDTSAFQRALDAVHTAGGGIVFVPTGTYLIATHLRVPAGTALVGVGCAPQAYSPKEPGSTLLAIEGAGHAAGTPFLSLMGPNSTIEGITVFYPRQTVSNPPVEYPWTIRGGGGGDSVSIINVLLVNPFQAVDLATNSTQRHYIRGLYGQPLSKGIWVDQCYDIGRIKDVHFWPFWSLDKSIVEYTTTHATTFIFQRTDWEIVDDIFAWGYNVGVELSASKYGAMNGQMANVNLDNVNVGLDVSSTQPYAVHVSNLNIANAGAGTDHVAIWGRRSTGSAQLAIRGGSFWGQLNQVLRWEIPGSISVSDSRLVEWRGSGPVVELLAGDALIHDNIFANGWNPKEEVTAIYVGPGAGGVLIHDNQLHGNRVDAGQAPRALVSNNQQ